MKNRTALRTRQNRIQTAPDERLPAVEETRRGLQCNRIQSGQKKETAERKFVTRDFMEKGFGSIGTYLLFTIKLGALQVLDEVTISMSFLLRNTLALPSVDTRILRR